MEAMAIHFASPLEGEAVMHRWQAMHDGRGVDREHSACCLPPSLSLPLKGGGERKGPRGK